MLFRGDTVCRSCGARDDVIMSDTIAVYPTLCAECGAEMAEFIGPLYLLDPALMPEAAWTAALAQRTEAEQAEAERVKES